jgi:hypothetical protein
MAGNQNPGYPNVVAGRAADDNTPTDIFMDTTAGALYTGNWVWNASTLLWEKMIAPEQVYGYNGTNWHPIRIDESTRSIQTVSYPHHEVHGGSMFHAYRGDTLATNDTIIIAITTPAGAKEQHVFWELYSAGGITFDAVRDLTSYTGGTAFTPKNQNHRSDKTSTCTVEVGSNGALADGITPSGGTEFDKHSFGSGKQSGGSSSHDEETILEAEEIVMYRIAAIGNNIVCDLHVTWYEHTPKAV